MPVITLTSDWGLKDFYAAAFKGNLLVQCPGAQLVDICHEVAKFDVQQGAFIFRNAYRHFPEGTVHTVCIKPQSDTDIEPVAFTREGHHFVGLNDGFFSLVFDQPPDEAVIPKASGEAFPSFDVKAIASAAAGLASGLPLQKIGRLCTHFESKSHLRPVIEENLIKGSVIYIDQFENAVTNISHSLFERIRGGRKFEIYVRGGEYHISTIKNRYHEESRSNMVALFNSAGMLEVGISQGNAASLLGLAFGDIIRVEFS